MSILWLFCQFILFLSWLTWLNLWLLLLFFYLLVLSPLFVLFKFLFLNSFELTEHWWFNRLFNFAFLDFSITCIEASTATKTSLRIIGILQIIGSLFPLFVHWVGLDDGNIIIIEIFISDLRWLASVSLVIIYWRSLGGRWYYSEVAVIKGNFSLKIVTINCFSSSNGSYWIYWIYLQGLRATNILEAVLNFLRLLNLLLVLLLIIFFFFFRLFIFLLKAFGNLWFVQLDFHGILPVVISFKCTYYLILRNVSLIIAFLRGLTARLAGVILDMTRLARSCLHEVAGACLLALSRIGLGAST